MFLPTLQAFLIQDPFCWTKMWTDAYVHMWTITERWPNESQIILVQDWFRFRSGLGRAWKDHYWFRSGSDVVPCLQGSDPWADTLQFHDPSLCTGPLWISLSANFMCTPYICLLNEFLKHNSCFSNWPWMFIMFIKCDGHGIWFFFKTS